MRPIPEGSSTLFLQPEIRFVHQGGALQGVVGTFPAHVMMRQTPQLVINQRQSRVQSLIVARVPPCQQLTDRLG